MKKHIILLTIVTGLFFSSTQAQHVRVQMNFPVGVSLRPTGPAPFSGAIWIGPEWKWNGREYIHVPGYWEKPRHHKRNRWNPGHWKRTRRGYIWVPGRWH